MVATGRTEVKTGVSTGIGKATALSAERTIARYLVGPGAKRMKNLARLPVGIRDRMMYQAIYEKQRS